MEDQDLSFGQAEARLWVKWVGANFVAVLASDVLVAIVVLVFGAASAAISGSALNWLWWALILGTMQWLVLRRWIPRILGWLIATVAGVFLYLTVLGLATSVGTAALNAFAHTSNVAWGGFPALWSGLVVGALLGASLGITQWIVLRRPISRAGWWVLATTAGWTVAALPDQASVCPQFLLLLAPGATTGIALVWLARPSLGEEADRDPHPTAEARPKRRACPNCGEQVSSRAVLCRHCKGWLVDRPQAAVAGEKQPAPEPAHADGPGRLWGMLLAIALGTLVALALPVAALAARAMACGPLHSSVIIFAVMTLVFCVPAAALPAALAWTMGRRRPDGGTAESGDFSLPRALAGGLLGVIIGFAFSAVCACMTFSPECL